MGQQQLLLLIFGIVIVGVAIVVGLVMFTEGSRQRQVDLITNHTLHVASEAAAWRSKESPFIGGYGSYAALAEDAAAMQRLLLMDETRIPGVIRVECAAKNDISFVAVSIDYPEIGIRTRVNGTRIVDTEVSYDGSITLPGGISKTCP